MCGSSSLQRTGKVLTTAFAMGMSATLAISRDRATGAARPLYYGDGNRIQGMLRVWKAARRRYQETVRSGSPDATPLLGAEANIRRSYTRVLLKTSVAYGGTGKKRQRGRSENADYLNALWDYGGAVLRNTVKSLFTFPTPATLVLTNGKCVAGYPGSRRAPLYPLRHSHLPELDFGDMIRSHLMELARQCLKYRVPSKAAKRYISELTQRLIPFLEYVYTERRVGRPNFIRGGLVELRAVLQKIRLRHGTRNGRPISVTEGITDACEAKMAKLSGHADAKHDGYDSTVSQGSGSFFSSLLSQVTPERRQEWRGFLEGLENLCRKGLVTEEDARYIVAGATEESRRIGSALHRYMSEAFPTAPGITYVIHQGSEVVYDQSGFLLLSELPLAFRRGRPDLVLFAHRAVDTVDQPVSERVYTPCLIAEIKTRSAFSLDIAGTPSKSRKTERIVIEPILEPAPMTDDQWEQVLAAAPQVRETTQVSEYGRLIVEEYQSVMQSDRFRPRELVQALIIVDSSEDWERMRQSLLPLILDAYSRASRGEIHAGQLLRPRDANGSLRMALRVVSAGQGLPKHIPVSSAKCLQPFWSRSEDGRSVILNLTVAGRGTQAESAAAIAERWHGFEYAKILASHGHLDVLWLDLTGELGDHALASERLFIPTRSDSGKRFFRSRVRIVDLSSVVDGYLHRTAPLQDICSRLNQETKGRGRLVVVVSGWHVCWKSSGETSEGLLDSLLETLLSCIPEGSTAIWFARPVPVGVRNTVYRMRCVEPFYRGSPWEKHVDSIVWNVPAPPSRTGSGLSAHESHRIIISERPDSTEPELDSYVVPVLEGWTDTFKSRSTTRLYFRGTQVPNPEGTWHASDSDCRNAILLVGHLREELPFSVVDTLPAITVEDLPVRHDNGERLDIAKRIQLSPIPYRARAESDGRIRKLLPFSSVNRKREYRNMELGAAQRRRSSLPICESFLSPAGIDESRIALSEFRSLGRTLNLLMRVRNGDSQWQELLSGISKIAQAGMQTRSSAEMMHALRAVRRTLEQSPLSCLVWQQHLPFRVSSSQSLSVFLREHIHELLLRNPDLLLITGNSLFLLLLSATYTPGGLPHTRVVSILWDYLRPWHLIALGLKAAYPVGHATGKSVMQRRTLLASLAGRAKRICLELETSGITGARFGELIQVGQTEDDPSTHLWFVLQNRVGRRNMDLALLPVRGWVSDGGPVDIIRRMVSGRTCWTESSIQKLASMAVLDGREERVTVMVAESEGLRALWVLNNSRGVWVPIATIEFTTRRREDVTLIRTLTLRESSELKPIPPELIPPIPERLSSQVDLALSLVQAVFHECVRAHCIVSVDRRKEMFSIDFVIGNQQGNEINRLSVEKTADLLELLRRPDDRCAPVVVGGRQLIWNRFVDIRYEYVAEAMRPWVERSNPFGRVLPAPPPTAHELINATKGSDIEVEPYHEFETCPLASLEISNITNEEEEMSERGPDYQYRFETHRDEPDPVQNEPRLTHGLCWRVRLHSTSDSSELHVLAQLHMSDSLLASFLSAHRIVYQSQEDGQWVVRPFRLRLTDAFLDYLQESWHLRRVVADELRREKMMIVPGSYLIGPRQWVPFFTIEPEAVVIGLRVKGTRVRRELKLEAGQLALRNPGEVRTILRNGMGRLLDKYSMVADDTLRESIAEEIEASLEIAGMTEQQAVGRFVAAEVRRDSSGMRRLCIGVRTSDGHVYWIPVLKPIHELKELRALLAEELDGAIREGIRHLRMSDKDIRQAADACISVLAETDLKIESGDE